MEVKNPRCSQRFDKFVLPVNYFDQKKCLFDLFLRNSLVVCYIFDPDILAGLSLVVGYQVVANG